MNFLKRFISSTSAVLGLLASIFQLLGIASVGSLLIPDAYRPGPDYLLVTLVFLGLVAGAAFSCYTGVRAFRNFVERYSQPFEILSESYELIVYPARVVQVTRRVVRSRRAGHLTVPHRYYWSGTAKPLIVPRLPVGMSYFEVGQSQHWTIGQFVFIQTVQRRQTIVLEFEHDIPRTVFQQYVSRIVEDITSVLTLKVRLADGTTLQAVTQLINRHPANEGAAQTVPTTISRPDEHEWRIPATTAHTQYMLGWSAS